MEEIKYYLETQSRNKLGRSLATLLKNMTQEDIRELILYTPTKNKSQIRPMEEILGSNVYKKLLKDNKSKTDMINISLTTGSLLNRGKPYIGGRVGVYAYYPDYKDLDKIIDNYDPELLYIYGNKVHFPNFFMDWDLNEL